MNILHIISAPASGGAEVYVKDLAKYLASEGHNIHVAFLSNAVDIGRDLAYQKEFMNDLQSKGVSTFFIGNETRKKPWLGCLRLRRYIKKNKIEICHTHLAYGIVFSSLSKIPVVYTHHTIQPRWGKIVYAIFNNLVNEYVGISEKCASALRHYTGRNVTTIFNAVSQDKFNGYTRLRTLEDKVKIAMVGRISPQKDYENMIEGISLLDPSILSRIQVVIAGEGDPIYRNKLISLIQLHNLNENIVLYGVTDNIPKFLYGSDLFLMTSAWEGLPIALTEATISGMPCIVTDVGGCSEVIQKSNNGIIIPPGSPQEVSKAVTKMLIEIGAIELYSQNALNSSKIYDISTAAHSHISLYSKLLND